ncbi:hypothetical protein KP509_20G082900 [Ceratopteris richardii]|uniref:Uncharacterized protein n=1 Tax=Ceratopteris richardii TaxID=49495 RepID=A0A8T2SIX9_CERRI|nr:hypothetical protein KP509_20G082900 [Ceratopteris richardii]
MALEFRFLRLLARFYVFNCFVSCVYALRNSCLVCFISRKGVASCMSTTERSMRERCGQGAHTWLVKSTYREIYSALQQTSRITNSSCLTVYRRYIKESSTSISGEVRLQVWR